MTDATPLEAAMRRALMLAANGPTTGGNPQVGCVLLRPDGSIAAEGWHHGAGTPHAEVDALGKVADARGLTAVVTLEPCNHTGRTGPCAEALVAAGVARVAYAVSDPSDRAGGGAARLRAAGVEVIGGVLEREATEFLEPWLTATRLGRPWVTVKWASSLDGRVAAADGTSQWVTGTASRQRVHEERAQHDAIVVGTGTVLADDPNLTARGDAGELLPHQPLPVVVGRTALPANARLRQHPRGFVETGSRDLEHVLGDLFRRDVRRVYVEGGPTLATAFVSAGFADEFSIYLAPKLLGGDRLALGDVGVGSIGEARELRLLALERLGDDIHVLARPARHDTAAVPAQRDTAAGAAPAHPATEHSAEHVPEHALHAQLAGPRHDHRTSARARGE